MQNLSYHRNIAKSYPGMLVLERVSIDVFTGEFRVLLSEFGAGGFNYKRNLHPISIPPIGDCLAGKG